MPGGVSPDRVIELLGVKTAEGLVRETMQQVYCEQLEAQIASLQERVRELEGESIGMVDRAGGQEAAWQPNREPAPL